MGLLVDLEETAGIYTGVALGRCQAGMAEQFLDGPQIHAVAEEVGGETVAHGMGSRGGGKAEASPQFPETLLGHAGIEPAAAGADEEGACGRRPVGAMTQVIQQRLPDPGQQGTMRALFPLPTIRRVSPPVMSLTSRARASPSLSPPP